MDFSRILTSFKRAINYNMDHEKVQRKVAGFRAFCFFHGYYSQTGNTGNKRGFRHAKKNSTSSSCIEINVTLTSLQRKDEPVPVTEHLISFYEMDTERRDINQKLQRFFLKFGEQKGFLLSAMDGKVGKFFCLFFDDTKNVFESNNLLDILCKVENIDLEDIERCNKGSEEHSGEPKEFLSIELLVNHYLDYHTFKLYQFFWEIKEIPSFEGTPLSEAAQKIILAFEKQIDYTFPNTYEIMAQFFGLFGTKGGFLLRSHQYDKEKDKNIGDGEDERKDQVEDVGEKSYYICAFSCDTDYFKEIEKNSQKNLSFKEQNKDDHLDRSQNGESDNHKEDGKNGQDDQKDDNNPDSQDNVINDNDEKNEESDGLEKNPLIKLLLTWNDRREKIARGCESRFGNSDKPYCFKSLENLMDHYLSAHSNGLTDFVEYIASDHYKSRCEANSIPDRCPFPHDGNSECLFHLGAKKLVYYLKTGKFFPNSNDTDQRSSKD
ncbi:uncharacterized protein LOC141852409 [Brevipalpus obovatus]|uniref:uncharacterized protein LOC141852409 n=1 Tax=Brevipalpus obovatus TaxID=246614 RepID=UPI003D9E7998